MEGCENESLRNRVLINNQMANVLFRDSQLSLHAIGNSSSVFTPHTHTHTCADIFYASYKATLASAGSLNVFKVAFKHIQKPDILKYTPLFLRSDIIFNRRAWLWL